MRRVSSGVNGAIPEILTGVNLPESSTIGKLPGDRIRSLTLLETLSMASNRAGVGTGLETDGTGVGAVLAAVSTLESFLTLGMICERDVGLFCDCSSCKFAERRHCWRLRSSQPVRLFTSFEDAGTKRNGQDN